MNTPQSDEPQPSALWRLTRTWVLVSLCVMAAAAVCIVLVALLTPLDAKEADSGAIEPGVFLPCGRVVTILFEGVDTEPSDTSGSYDDQSDLKYERSCLEQYEPLIERAKTYGVAGSLLTLAAIAFGLIAPRARPRRSRPSAP